MSYAPFRANFSENLGVDENPDLIQWIQAQIGKGPGKFRSPRAFSIRAGLNENTVGKILERGRAEPLTLQKLADAAKRPLDEAYAAAGLIPEGVKPTDETERQLREWVQIFYDFPNQRQRLIRAARALAPELDEHPPDPRSR